jgi:hypothetical protein
MSVNVAALSPQLSGIVGTVGLYYTTDMSLPSTASNNSLVATLNSSGGVATFHGNWTAVPRSGLGPAQFAVGSSATTNFNDYGLNGWNMAGIAACNTATYFAIVVGFATLNLAGTIDIGSISLVPGNIPCRPGAQSDVAVISDCQYFYEMSFATGTVPATALGLGTGEYYGVRSDNAGGKEYSVPIVFKNKKIAIPTLTIYNPVNANNQIYNVQSAVDFSGSAAFSLSTVGCILYGTPDVGGVASLCAAHFTADSRLGL